MPAETAAAIELAVMVSFSPAATDTPPPPEVVRLATAIT